MAVVPKHKVLRAIRKAGLANDSQLKIIDQKWSKDKGAQLEMTKIWKGQLGHRFMNGMAALIGWVIRHWDEIKIALGIVALFLDEAPEEAKEEPVDVPDYVEPPKPEKDEDDEELDRLIAEEEADKPVNPWTTANKVGDEE